MDMNTDKYQLGKTSAPFLISSRQENYDLLLNMLQQAQQSLSIFSYNFDGQLYNTSEFISSLRSLSLDNRNSQVRILIQDMNFLVKHSHRVIELSRRLPTSFEIRESGPQFEHLNSCYSILDGRGVILRSDAMRYDAKVDFHDPRLAKELLKQFNEIWDQSEPSPEIQRLHI
jgi:hypothetical protein